MMNQVLFITGNSRKVWQATDALKPFGVEVVAKEIDLPEIQSHDALEIAVAKARAAYAELKEPLVICDHAWAVPALKGFPAGYMKDINYWFESSDWLALMRDKQDRRAILTESVIYIDGEDMNTFSLEFTAHFIHEQRGEGQNSNERILVYEGFDETIAERVDAGKHARDITKSAWSEFGAWYKANKL